MSHSVDGFTRHEINRHIVITEPDRIVHLILHGRLDAEESTRFRSIMYDYGGACGVFAVLADISKADGITTEARKVWVHIPRPLPIEISCMYGGSFAARTLAQTVYRASVLLRPQAFKFPIAMPGNEAEARAAVAAFRKAPQVSSSRDGE